MARPTLLTAALLTKLDAIADSGQTLKQVCAHLTAAAADDVQATQLAYYEPVSPTARRIHLSTAREIPIVGGP